MTYKLFDHTADIGIHVEAADLNTLFAESGCGLFEVIAGSLDQIELHESITISVKADSSEDLLVDWLTELLIQFELNKMLLSRFEVEIDGTCLSATAWGEPVDFSRHRLAREVKAITYHELRIEHTDTGWNARVIVDI